MDYKLLTKSAAELILGQGELLKVFEPQSVILYEGDPKKRRTSVVRPAGDLKVLVSKRNLTVTTIEGPSSLVVSLPRGCYVNIFPINGDDPFLYNFRNVLFCTGGITYRSRLLLKDNVAMAFATRSIIATSFSGSGHVGIASDAELLTRDISGRSVYVNVNNVISIPKSAEVKVTCYGNDLSAQIMQLHYLIKGTKASGEYIVYQGASVGPATNRQQGNAQGGLPQRLVKKYIPGADLFID